MNEINERCPGCNTLTVVAPGIGPYCPNRACYRLDDLQPQSEPEVGYGLLIIPDSLDSAIKVLIDSLLPVDGEDSRAHFRNVLVDYYNQHGTLPNPDQIRVVKVSN